MFGHRFFGERFYGSRYFGPDVADGEEPPPEEVTVKPTFSATRRRLRGGGRR